MAERPFQHGRRAGVTLVEVMLAGSLLAFACCAFMEGLLVVRRILHEEHGSILAADAYAFDVAWTLLNTSADCPPFTGTGTSNLGWTLLRSATGYSRNFIIPEKDAPALRASNWPAPRVYIAVTPAGNEAEAADAITAAGKWVSVNVTWGPAGARRQLWGDVAKPCESGVTRVYGRTPRRLFRSADIERVQETLE